MEESEFKILIERFKVTEDYTYGRCTVFNDNQIPIFSSLSLERGWLNNEKNISSIPTGVFECKFEYSPKFNTNLWEIYGVEGRTECKFHVANFVSDLNGCIALGNRLADLNSDHVLDIANSRNAIIAFNQSLISEIKKIVELEVVEVL